MRAGKMDRRVALLKRVAVQDSLGGEDVTYEPAGIVWAEWLEGQGREFFAAARVHSEISVVCKIRWRSDVQADWRVEYAGRLYEIVGHPAELGRREGLRLSLRSIS